jgi:hypothetical protein
MKVHGQPGRPDAIAKSLCRDGFCVHMALPDAIGRADAPRIASARPIASRINTWTQKSFPGKSLRFEFSHPASKREKVMDLEAIFGLDTSSASPSRPGTPQCLGCSSTPPPDEDAAFESFVCRAIERDLGLPPGSLTLWEPNRCPGERESAHSPRA